MNDLNEYLKNARLEYSKHGLLEAEMESHPIAQFKKWMKNALEQNLNEPYAMHVATVSADGRPSSRIVLLRGFDEKGFVFYTNYNSRKGKNIAENKQVCASFYWHELERQVHICGSAEKISAEESDHYFNSRPRANQLGALVSEQSNVIAGREILDDRLKHLEKELEGKKIPRPEHWGGYLIRPESMEFWQGRPSRLHDRILYSLISEGSWKMERLSP